MVFLVLLFYFCCTLFISFIYKAVHSFCVLAKANHLLVDPELWSFSPPRLSLSLHAGSLRLGLLLPPPPCPLSGTMLPRAWCRVCQGSCMSWYPFLRIQLQNLPEPQCPHQRSGHRDLCCAHFPELRDPIRVTALSTLWGLQGST